MSTRSRPTDEARRRWDRLVREIGDELRTGRQINGATQRQVGRSIRVSQSEISRRELGRPPAFTGPKLAAHAAAVGLRLSIKLWPVGGGIGMRRRPGTSAHSSHASDGDGRVILEAPIQQPGDLRAVDILLVDQRTARIAVEVITRLADLQAQVRAVQLKVARHRVPRGSSLRSPERMPTAAPSTRQADPGHQLRSRLAAHRG